MTIHPPRTEFGRLAREGNLIPVYADFIADFETPLSAFSKLRDTGPAYLLESIEGGANLQRYSFIGVDPEKTISVWPDRIEIRSRDGHFEQRDLEEDPLDVIRREMSSFQPVEMPGLPRFTGGAVGFVGFEYVHYIEPTVPLAQRDPTAMPLLHFLITDTIVIFDRARQTLRILSNAHTEGGIDQAYEAACERIENIRDRLRSQASPAPAALRADEEVTVPPGNFERPQYEDLVRRAKEYIRAGDIFQVVLSQRFEQDFDRSPMDLYRALRVVNPSPYMILYDAGDFSLVGASPEVHVRLTGRLAETRPIAGTRPRGETVEADIEFEKDLLADEKELAEHLMLVDLSRNDLGRVCTYGTVHVPEYMVVERYSHVMHIVSQVEGELAEGRDAYDLMRATFPAGTVSGAPKIRAMQIIGESEGEMRGPYAGAVCYFSYNGNLDSCITIRTALLRENRLYIQSGAGIVADSDPGREYDETINKARAMLKAVRLAESLD